MDHRIPRILRNLRLCGSGPAFQQGRASPVLSAGRVSVLNPLNVHKDLTRGRSHISCPECGKCFSQESKSLTNIRDLTRGKKPYSCPECGKCFSAKSSLNTHQRSHTGRSRILS
ncbi:unnamed protein product [Staurois parvus]|uniref:C2H2-type domain-containing protein n=1 Tax=Staurois parvus TaxID=386267 RepID=A0ABN9CKZ6_9NEOB|nr:unnamed protein product [Staurois parvus]